MIEIFFIGLIIFFFIWIVSKFKKPRDVVDNEIELREEFHEKEKRYLNQIQELKLEHRQEMADIARQHVREEKGFRKDSVNRSRFSLTGKIYEQICSIFKGFPYNPADMRFLGSPCDYIVFHGMVQKSIDKVIFLEVKTGDSKLTEQQEKLKQAIKAKRVEWKEYRLKPKGLNSY